MEEIWNFLIFGEFLEEKNRDLLVKNREILLNKLVSNFPGIKLSVWFSHIQMSISVLMFTLFFIIWIEVCLSFVPIKRKEKLIADSSVKDFGELNCMYFGDQRRFGEKELLISLFGKCFAEERDSVEFDLADQIIQNAQICDKKFNHFNRAIGC